MQGVTYPTLSCPTAHDTSAHQRSYASTRPGRCVHTAAHAIGDSVSADYLLGLDEAEQTASNGSRAGGERKQVRRQASGVRT